MAHLAADLNSHRRRGLYASAAELAAGERLATIFPFSEQIGTQFALNGRDAAVCHFV
jgi:hypothetical protein